MTRIRTAGVVAGLTFVGGMLGAAAGIMTVAAILFSMELRHGRVGWPFTEFGSILGGLVGGGLGALMTPTIAFGPWRHIPIGKLFTHLTLGTLIGGCGAALVLPSPVLVILGGVIGFIVAGDRLASRVNSSFPVEQGSNDARQRDDQR